MIDKMREEKNINQGENTMTSAIAINKGSMLPRFGTKFEIITNDPFVDNGIYEYRRRKTAEGFGNSYDYEYGCVMLVWYKPDGTIQQVNASAVVPEPIMNEALKIDTGRK